MKTKSAAMLMGFLPDRFTTYVSKRVVDYYLKKYATIKINGKENLAGIVTPTIFICNHLSNSDGLVLDKALKTIDPTFVAGVKLSDNAVTNIGMKVVKTTNIRPNSADKEGLKNLIKLVKGGESVLIFPEGTRSRVGSLIEAKKGIVLIAKLTGVPLVPVGLYGTEKLLPVNKEGDMSAEGFHHADVHVHIGKQFELPEKAKDQDKKDYEEFATDYLMKQISALLPEAYRGVYPL
ncbi:MAG: 1-acyl-sn-glycerol-3-phosphate acyltransferase [Clostridia bacterium]|nr:1-acyl-sn-glycerol-3-phosphate acyltransferase [Clostridia bacterium]